MGLNILMTFIGFHHLVERRPQVPERRQGHRISDRTGVSDCISISVLQGDQLRTRASLFAKPWASLIVAGVKDVENRTWPMGYRGRVLSHSSLRADDTSSEDIERRFDVSLPSESPLGGIVGMTEIVDCVRPHPDRWYAPAHWAFVLANSGPLPFEKRKGATSRCAPSVA